MSVQPRDHQLSARRGVYASWRAGHTRTVLVMPTGSGKSFLGCMVVGDAIAKGRKVLWIVHRTSLVDQACRALHEHGLAVGAIAAEATWPARDDAWVQVCTIQTLMARDIRPPADLIVWDECHHCGESAAEWVSLLEAYPTTRMLGLTATPERGDGTGLGPTWEDLHVGVTVRQLTALGLLVPCEVIRPGTWLRAGRVSGNPLAQDPLDAYRTHAGSRQTFAFAASVEEAERFAREFTVAGIMSGAIHARTPGESRNRAMRLYRDGVLRVLWNVYVLTEGVDVPQAECCMLARGVSTAGGFLQMVGRVLRSHPGKTGALLIDLPGISHVWGMPEDERLYKLYGKAIVLAGQVCRVCGQPVAEYPCAKCGFAPVQSEEREQGQTEITGDPLAKFARMIAQGPRQRYETLLRWLNAAKIKGHKPRSVAYKWRAVYQEDLDQSTFSRACQEVGL
jgi:superfamily II DNA or RNA helicase